jgi:hypothetical protein
LNSRRKETSLLVVSKPTGSKVSLTKDADSLEIIMPPAGFSSHIGFLCFFAIIWNFGIFEWTVRALSAPFPGHLFFALFSLPFWYQGISIVQQILFALFGRIRLTVNKQQISLTYELFGFKYNRPRPAPRQDITQLEVECQGDHKLRMIIWAGTQQYQLSGYVCKITAPEFDWLGHELSDWLRLPIQVRRLPPVEM